VALGQNARQWKQMFSALPPTADIQRKRGHVSDVPNPAVSRCSKFSKQIAIIR
jgi:hypothetical protein